MTTQFKSTKVEDFMPWPHEEEPEATPEAIMHILKGAMKVKK